MAADHAEGCMLASNNHTVTIINKLKLTDDDFRRLNHGQWLNCKLLEAYFWLVAKECSQQGVDVKVLNSHFWSQFVANGYQAIKHWIAKDDILHTDVIFGILNTTGYHWTLLYMDHRRRCLWHLDPLTGTPVDKTVNDFKGLINDISIQTKGLPFTWEDWNFTPDKLPLQPNNNDCGVFICYYALYLMGICSKDDTLTRQQMIQDLKSKTLLRQAKVVSTGKQPSKTQKTLLHYFSASKAPNKSFDRTEEAKTPLSMPPKGTGDAASNSAASTPPKRKPDITDEVKPPSPMSPKDTSNQHIGDSTNADAAHSIALGIDSDDNTEGFDDPSNSPSLLATPKEKYLWGLLKGKSYDRSNVIVKNVEGRGRSAFAAKPFMAGDYICAYGGTVRKKMGADWGDQRNASLGLGCYCLDAVYENETYVFDATASINDPGRYINHARRNCNLTLMKPVKIGEPPNSQLKIGFVAKKNIKAGEELFFNYGIKDPNIEWLSTNAKKMGTSLQELTALSPPQDPDIKWLSNDAKEVGTSSQALTAPPSPQQESSTSKSRPRRPPAKRSRRNCPIPGCNTINVTRLACHIRVLHPEYSQAERLIWLRKSKLKSHTIDKMWAHREPTTVGAAQKLTDCAKSVDASSHAVEGQQRTLPDPLPAGQRLHTSNVTPTNTYMPKSTLPKITPQPDSSSSQDHLVPSSSAVDYIDDALFRTYLRVTHNKNRDTVEAIIRDVHGYLRESKGSEPDLNKLLNTEKLESYLKKMKEEKQYKPTTRTEKLRRIKLAIRFMIRGKDDQLYTKGMRVIDCIEEWTRGHAKDIAIQRQEHALVMKQRLRNIIDPNEFLEHDLVEEKLYRAFQEISSGNMSKFAIDTVTAYAAAIILYGNGQRSGVITNLTIMEFQMREEEEDQKVVIPCVHHKTASQGLAQLVVTEDIEHLLVYYQEKVRKTIVPADNTCKDKFFLTFNGGLYTQVYRRMKEGLSVGNIHPPVPSDYRVLISSDARRYLGEIDRRNVVKHLSHSMQTSEQFYEFTNTKDATDAHHLIHSLSICRRWSQTEIAGITQYWPLSGSMPSIRECNIYLSR